QHETSTLFGYKKCLEKWGALQGSKMGNAEIRDNHLSRIAYVYIRQSTPYQTEHNLESQRRQYQLVEKAKGLGRRDVVDQVKKLYLLMRANYVLHHNLRVIDRSPTSRKS
ncbi:MAG: hypothetical protein ACP5Q3_11170, partial [bacterium]